MKRLRFVWHFLGCVAILAGMVALIMVLWNWLIPTVIGWNAINYWQALGLAFLCRLLLGGFHPHGHKRMHRKFHKKHAHLHEMFEGMSRDEKRDYIRRKMTDFCDKNPEEFRRENDDIHNK